MSCLFHANRHLNSNKLHIGTPSSWVTASAGETLIENGRCVHHFSAFYGSWTQPWPPEAAPFQLLLRNIEQQQPKVELTRAAFAATQTVASENCQSVSQASLLLRRLVVQLVVQLRHPARLAHNLSTSSGFRPCSPSVLIKKQSAAGNQHSGPCCARCCRKRFTALNSLWFGQGLKVNLVRIPLEALS